MNQIASIVRRYWLPLLAWNSLILAATIAATIYATTNISPFWKANAKLNIPEKSDGLNSNLGTLGELQSRGTTFNKDFNPLQVQLAVLTSDAVMERVRAADPEKNLYSSLSSYKKLFTVTPEELSTAISVEVQAGRPDLAYKRLATLIEIYQQRLNELRYEDADVRQEFSQTDLDKARNNLQQAQTALTNFQKSTGLVDILEQNKGLIATINQLKATRANLIAQAQSNETQVRAAAASLGVPPQQAMNSLRLGENKEYQAIRDRVAEVEANLSVIRSRYRDDSPHVQSLLQQRQELLQQLNRQIAVAIPNGNTEGIDQTLGGNSSNSRIEMLAELVRNQTLAQGLRQQANQIQNQIYKLNTELNYNTANQARLFELQRGYEIAEGVYKGIIARGQEGKANPFNVYPNVQTIDGPTIDPKAIRPRADVIAFGGILAAIFGSMALISFLENRNPLLKPKDLQQVELPVLGSIPRLKRPNLERQHRGIEIEIEFQRLASAVLMLEQQHLMVTSATAGEGKTTVTLGLALALVNFGFRVLVVDGDLRKAELSRRLGHPQTQKTANAIPTPVSVYPGLDLMPAPSISKGKITEYCARGGFEQCLCSLKDSGSYDYVIVDSAPVGLTSETNLMSAVVRNVLFVLRAGTSNLYPVMDSIEQLTRHNAQILGMVVNGVESQTEGYRYYGRPRELMETEV